MLEFRYFVALVLGIWIIILLVDKKKLEKKGIERGPLFLMYRTEKGLVVVDFFAKKAKKLWNVFSSLAVVISIPLIFFILYVLISGAIHIVSTPGAPATLTPIIPGVEIPGSPIYVPLGYGIFALFITIVIHELSHGIIARVAGVKLKSTGLFIFAIIPGAFVEPDEDELNQSSKLTRLRIYAAAPFANIFVSLLSLIILATLVSPGFFQYDYIEITKVAEGSPAEKYGLEENSILISMNERKVKSLEDFHKIVKELKPDQEIIIETDKGKTTVKTVKRPLNTPEENILYVNEGLENRGYIGIIVKPHFSVKPQVESILGDKIPWIISKTLFWISLLNQGLGFANLIPFSFLDGGKIFRESAEIILPRGAKHLAGIVSVLTLSLILVNMSPMFGIS